MVVLWTEAIIERAWDILILEDCKQTTVMHAISIKYNTCELSQKGMQRSVKGAKVYGPIATRLPVITVISDKTNILIGYYKLQHPTKRLLTEYKVN